MWGDLKTIDVAGLYQANQKRAEAQAKFDATAGIADDLITRENLDRHEARSLVSTGNATKLLERLPEPNEVFHVLMSGKFDGWDYVAAVLDLAKPATIAELYVSTLGFGVKNAGQLMRQLDSGQIGKVWFIASCYMRDGSHKDKFKAMSDALVSRGHHMRAIRNHSKILAMKLTDGRTYCVDGSINLCSCNQVEQAHVWASPKLFEFYSGYIREQAEAKEHVK